MPDHAELAARFLGLHRPDPPLLMPNAWDQGSARLLTSLGFGALATTSSGHAATLGRRDGAVTRDEALAHAAVLVAAAGDVPVSADFENCFAHEPEGVAETVALALEAGLAGCSIEDYDPEHDAIYDIGRAAERVAAAAEAAHSGPVHLVLTARAENHFRQSGDLADTIARLQRYQEAGADVLFAPGLDRLDDIREVVASVDLPVSVVARPTMPPVAQLGAAGVARVSVGGAFTFAALGTLVEAARELSEDGTFGFLERAAVGGRAAGAAFE